MRNAHKPHTPAQAPDTKAETAEGTPVSMLFLNAIARSGADEKQFIKGFEAMRDALRFGFELEPVFRLQASMSLCTQDHSRCAGAIDFLLYTLEQYEAAGATWDVPDTVPLALGAAMVAPGGVRSTYLAFLPQSLEDVAISYLCTLVQTLQQKNPSDFQSKRPASAGAQRPAHKLAMPKAEKSIPAVQRGRVIRN